MLVLRFTKTHTLNRIINYSTLKIFSVFNFRRNAISTKIDYGENFPIYGINNDALMYILHSYCLKFTFSISSSSLVP